MERSPFDVEAVLEVAIAVEVYEAATAPVVESLLTVATNKEPLVVPRGAVFTVLPAALCEAEATGAEATVKNPANRAVVTVSDNRFRSVVFDIFFLSLVRFRNFLDLARRFFRSSNSISKWHTRVMPLSNGNLVIR